MFTHVENCHLVQGEVPPNDFLVMHERWVCPHCLLLVPQSKACRRCKALQGGSRKRLCFGEVQHAATCSSSSSSSSSECTTTGVGNEPSVSFPILPTPSLATVNALKDIYWSKLGLLRHVPKKCRVAWCDALCRAFENFIQHKDVPSALLLLLLPKLVLSSPPRGGKSHQGQVSSIVAKRLSLFVVGEYDRLVGERKAFQQQITSLPRRSRRIAELSEGVLLPHTIRAVSQAVQDGALSKAAKILASSGSSSLPPAADIERSLRQLHPQGPCSLTPPPGVLQSGRDADIVQLEFDREAILQALREFPVGSSGGLSGLTAGHLLEASDSPFSALFVGLICLVVCQRCPL